MGKTWRSDRERQFSRKKQDFFSAPLTGAEAGRPCLAKGGKKNGEKMRKIEKIKIMIVYILSQCFVEKNVESRCHAGLSGTSLTEWQKG
ncbi:hypothetical protein [uncultured Desulfovibrio sp.]|uniref:hypothetical protein n=1 Tax=uncultured Desulfovibrio sp. TaxID=167968 RepID=UPI00261E084B|nr:hypothetical protein [uncultured Desulfovibrio sp.]